MNIDEWIGITTPKGEKINVNIFSDEEYSDTEKGTHFYFEIEDEVKLVKRIEERCVDIFVARSKLSKQKIKRNWDRKDWWIDADECLECGLVDEIRAMMPEYKNARKKKAKKKNE